MRYERRYSQWKDEPNKVSFTLVLSALDGPALGSQLVELNKPYTAAQMLVAIRAAVRNIETAPDGDGAALLARLLLMENQT